MALFVQEISESHSYEIAYDHFLHSPGENVVRMDGKTKATEARLQLSDTDGIFSHNSDLCLDGRLSGLSTHIVAAGGFSDVWNGYLAEEKVAIKVIRRFASSGETVAQDKLRKRLWREYLAWSRHSHPNILKCLGFAYLTATDPPALVSPWMSNGTVPRYLENNPTVDRIFLLLGIAEGLLYLHTCDPSIVHGDLRAGNVLVSATGVPCLSDFGLSRVLSEIKGMTTSTEVAGSLRWMSPELLQEDNGVSKGSDVWAFGMTMLEICSGQHPYLEIKKDAVVFGSIMNGSTPSRPWENKDFMSDHIWKICQQCWSIQPAQRPSMQEVEAKLLAYELSKGLLTGSPADIFLFSGDESGGCSGDPVERYGPNATERLDSLAVY